MHQFMFTLVMCAISAVFGGSPDSAGMQDSMTFVVVHMSGSARDNSTTTEILGVVKAATPEKAVQMFAHGSQREHWKFHEESRSSTYVRLENPISFVSDMIDHISATAGKVIRDKDGKIQFTVVEVDQEAFPGGNAPLSKKTVWALDASEALASIAAKYRKCEVSNNGASPYSASLTCPSTKEGLPRVWQATAMLQIIGKPAY